MKKSVPKPTIAVYSGTFLTISMTFIYRQMIGISHAFRPIVFTSKVENPEVFPFDFVYEKEGYTSLAGRTWSKLCRWASKKYTRITRTQLKYWLRICRRENVELIHAHFGYGGLQMLPVAQTLQIPLVTTFHGIDASKLLRNGVYVSNLQELFKYSHVICVSKKMKEQLLQLGANPHQTYTHYIGAPVDEFTPLTENEVGDKRSDTRDGLTFLQVSNFVPKKGHWYTIQAFHQFAREHSGSRLILAGDGPLRDAMVKLSMELGLDGKVEFPGKVTKPQVIDLMRKADIFVHHSVTADDGDQEGIPIVLVEAMSMGLPVITTRHSAIPELVRDGRDGFLVEEGNIEEYVSMMKKGISFQPEGTQAWIHKHFDMHQNNEELITIYRKVINEKGSNSKRCTR